MRVVRPEIVEKCLYGRELQNQGAQLNCDSDTKITQHFGAFVPKRVVISTEVDKILNAFTRNQLCVLTYNAL